MRGVGVRDGLAVPTTTDRKVKGARNIAIISEICGVGYGVRADNYL
jgi:hypothetical protein